MRGRPPENFPEQGVWGAAAPHLKNSLDRRVSGWPQPCSLKRPRSTKDQNSETSFVILEASAVPNKGWPAYNPTLWLTQPCTRLVAPCRAVDHCELSLLETTQPGMIQAGSECHCSALLPFFFKLQLFTYVKP